MLSQIVPFCNCGQRAQRRASQQPHSLGRMYFTCGKDFKDSTRCKFFKWAGANPTITATSSSGSNNGANTLQSTNDDMVNDHVKATDAIDTNTTTVATHATSQRQQNRNYNKADDAAYLSSIASSATCPQHQVPLLRRETKAGGKFYYKCPYNDCRTFKWENSMHAAYQCDHTGHANASNGANAQPEADLPEVHFMVVMHPDDGALRPQRQRAMLQVILPTNMVSILKPTIASITDYMCSPTLNHVFYIPLEKYAHIVKLFNLRRDNCVKVKQVPSKVFHLLNMYDTVDITDRSLLPKDRLPEKLLHALKPFQMEGVLFGLQRNGRIMLADEMGLGKTIQAIALAFLYEEEWPLLIICPSSLRFNWSKELEDWLVPHIQPRDIKILLSGKERPSSRINIISYDLVKGDIYDYIRANPFKVVIADECHYLKNASAQRTRNIRPLIQNSSRAIMITGTPALSRPIELFTQMEALLRQQGYDHWFGLNEYRFRYCDAKVVPGFLGKPMVEDKGYSNLEELNHVLSRTVMIRRLKKDVLKELPKKNRQVVRVQVNKTDMKKLKKRVEEYITESKKSRLAQQPEEHEQHQKNFHNKYMQTYHTTGVAKLKAISSYIKELIDLNWCKFIVFAHHREVMDGIEKTLKSVKVGYIRIDGQTPSIKRKQYCDHFQEDESCMVALLSLKAANVGLTLTAANLVLFSELGFTPGDHLQAEDRVHRIGQREDVIIRYILGMGTLDDALWPMLESKLEVMGKTLDANANATSEFIDAKVNYETASSSSTGGPFHHHSTTLDQHIMNGEEYSDGDDALDTYDDGSGFVVGNDELVEDGEWLDGNEMQDQTGACSQKDMHIDIPSAHFHGQQQIVEDHCSYNSHDERCHDGQRSPRMERRLTPATPKPVQQALMLGIDSQRQKDTASPQMQQRRAPKQRRARFTSKNILQAMYADINRNCVNLKEERGWKQSERETETETKTSLTDRDIHDSQQRANEMTPSKGKTSNRKKPSTRQSKKDMTRNPVHSDQLPLDHVEKVDAVAEQPSILQTPPRRPVTQSKMSPRTPTRSPYFSQFAYTPPSGSSSTMSKTPSSSSPLSSRRKVFSQPLFTPPGHSVTGKKQFLDLSGQIEEKSRFEPPDGSHQPKRQRRHTSTSTGHAIEKDVVNQDDSSVNPQEESSPPPYYKSQPTASQWEEDFMAGLL